MRSPAARPRSDEADRGRLKDVLVALALACRADPSAVALLVLAALCAGGAPVLSAWLTKLLLDGITQPSPGALRHLLVWAGSLAAAGVISALVPHAAVYAGNRLSRRVKLTVRDRLFTKTGTLQGLAQLEDPRFHNRLMLAQQAGSESPGQILTSLLGLLQGGLTLGGFLVALILLSPVMAGVVTAAVIPALLAETALNRRRAGLRWRLGPAERREIFYTDLLRDLKAAKEVRLFGLAGFLRGRMLSEMRTINAAKDRLDRRALHTQGGLSLLSAAVAGAGLVWATRAALSGEFTAGDVAMFAASVAGAQGSLASVVRSLSGVHDAMLMFGHHQAVMRTPSTLPVPAAACAVPPLRRGIEFRGVWFRYAEDQPWILRGVDLFIASGETTALVGHNGEGKSTLVKLLCRLYDPTRGVVLWDGVDLRDLDPAELRERMSAVFQDYTCYDLTAGENIGLGDLSALGDRPRVAVAARRAGVHDLIDGLPHGYDTFLSRMFENPADDDPASGMLLSGGQWQRVALARAFLRDDRDLLILDEPSSGLDAEAEYEIHKRLGEYRAGRTSLLISHRMGTTRAADHIAVLSDGRIAEQGDHGRLLAAGGIYARLFRTQSRGYREPDEAEADLSR
ncbi:ABC transporter ATP-binding protein [Streptomyces caelestis]|uniref:ABC transporter ATP-binding protein n=1 Tax=Streptomyces heliomycini TaxID=284032 RepID=A0ABV5LDK4_9ACTN|nr:MULTISPECIES: ABC transporter ATP-binding protein [Streptomyces]